MKTFFNDRINFLRKQYQDIVILKNEELPSVSGIFNRCLNPVLTADHIPLNWRFDFDADTNPYLLERFGINAVFNSGAIKFNNKYVLLARVEGKDRKSFFALAESDNGIDNFIFKGEPILLPETNEPETNVYDMRLVQHEDGWLYGLFCTERRDDSVPEYNQTAALANCGIVRTRDLVNWERLPNLKTNSPQQRNVVLHPEFINDKYAFYTRPQDSFIEAGKGGGIGFALSDSIENAVAMQELIIDNKKYHTVYETKNGLGPAPIKTAKGWLHLAHGVRNTAAGLRYVLYLFMTDLKNPAKIIYKPGGYFIAPEGEERIGDVPNVVFSNGWILDGDGKVFIYYASSDTKMHVAVSHVDKLLDYVMNTAADTYSSNGSVNTINKIIERNNTISFAHTGNGIVIDR